VSTSSASSGVDPDRPFREAVDNYIAGHGVTRHERYSRSV
jgi:hypothetical protein